MSSFLLSLPNSSRGDGRETKHKNPINSSVDNTVTVEPVDEEKQNTINKWINDTRGGGTGLTLPVKVPEAPVVGVSEDLLEKATNQAWVNPKELADLIRARTVPKTTEDVQTRTGDDLLLLPETDTASPAQLVRTALEVVTEEMKSTHLAAKDNNTTPVRAIRKGFKPLAHQGELVETPNLAIRPVINATAAQVTIEKEEEAAMDPQASGDDDYQSSIVDSLRKDFSDFKQATESYMSRIDRVFKQMDARLRAIESQPVLTTNPEGVKEHRRVLSTSPSSIPIATYTPSEQLSMATAPKIDTTFVIRIRYTSSPAVQHSILTKYLGAKFADILGLPIKREMWSPKGLAELLANVPI
jgi:hypothetical protein